MAKRGDNASYVVGNNGHSWHVQGGTPLFALQELAGWKAEEMVRRYAHLAAELALLASPDPSLITAHS